MTSTLKASAKLTSSSSDIFAKPSTALQRSSIRSTATKTEPSIRMTLRSAALKSKNADEIHACIQQEKNAPTARSLKKPAVTRAKRTDVNSSSVHENKSSKLPSKSSNIRSNDIPSSSKYASSPTPQPQKSLREHLAEIRANATPRRASEIASPVAGRLRKNSKLTLTTSVTSPYASLRRSNSLIPKTSGGRPASALTGTVSTTTTTPVVSKALLDEKEAELTALKQRCEASSAEWNKTFDVFCIFSQWAISERYKYIEWATEREKELEANVKILSEECARFKEDTNQLIQQHAKMQTEQAEVWEQERASLHCEMETLRTTLKAEKEKEIEKIRSQGEADISELQKAYDVQLAEERKVWAARVAESHKNVSAQLDQQQIEHETQIAELKRQYANRVSEIEGRLKSTESELLAKIELLQSECNEFRKAAEEDRERRASPELLPPQFPSSTLPSMCDFAVQMPAYPEEEEECLQASKKQNQENEKLSKQPSPSFNFDDIPISMTRSCYMPPVKPQAEASFFSPGPTRLKQQCHSDSIMEEEIKSLKTVLELKSSESADLRQKVMLLEEQLLSAKDLIQEMKILQNKNDILGAQLEMQGETKKKLQDDFLILSQNLDKEIREKKKLKMECESLRFKLLDAHHKIEQLNTANAGEDDGYSMTDSLYMSRSVCSDVRVTSSNSGIERGGSRPISESLENSIVDADDHLPAGSFIALDNRPATSSTRMRRGIIRDRTKRRTLASSNELQR